MTRVSVIIPVHNTEKYLPTCLNSVLNQTEKSIEVIAINDHSTDHSLEILNEFQKMYPYRLKVVDMLEKRGVSAARNLGLNLAQGEFIGFVDSDDYISLNMYHDFYETAKKYNVDAVVGNFYRIENDYKEEEGFISRKEVPIHCNYFHLPTLLYYETPSVWDKLYSHNILENYEFLENHIYEDVGFTYPILLKAKRSMQYCRADYFYRETNGSIMDRASLIQTNILDIIDVCNHAMKKASSWNLKQMEIECLINLFSNEIFERSQFINDWPIQQEEKEFLINEMLSIANYYFPNLLEFMNEIERKNYKLIDIRDNEIATHQENLKQNIQKLEKKYNY